MGELNDATPETFRVAELTSFVEVIEEALSALFVVILPSASICFAAKTEPCVAIAALYEPPLDVGATMSLVDDEANAPLIDPEPVRVVGPVTFSEDVALTAGAVMDVVADMVALLTAFVALMFLLAKIEPSVDMAAVVTLFVVLMSCVEDDVTRPFVPILTLPDRVVTPLAVNVFVVALFVALMSAAVKVVATVDALLVAVPLTYWS